ncbi:MAG: Crp/Fnr family transcriptional regulator [Pseudomonadota bacterium]
MSSSCMVKHFQHYAALSESEQKLLDSLEKSPQEYKRSCSLWTQGDESEDFYSVKKGWAYSYRDLEDGSRQVLDVYVPGDIIGLREFAFEKRISGLELLTDGVLCAFPKTRLSEIFAESLLLCNIFFMIASRDQAILVERLVNLGRRSAREKVAHFLVELARRLEKTNRYSASNVHLPLTQALLADALGLSAVHTNRTFHDLKAENLVDTAASGIDLLDLEGLSRVAGFDPAYLEEDLNALLHLKHDAKGK